MVEKVVIFEEELTNLINRYSMGDKSDTPDFMLAEYLLGCLRVYELITNRRDNWNKLEEE